MAHAHYMLDNEDYKHTHAIYNTCCLSTAAMVARKQLNIKSHVQMPALLTVQRNDFKQICPHIILLVLRRVPNFMSHSEERADTEKF